MMVNVRAEVTGTSLEVVRKLFCSAMLSRLNVGVKPVVASVLS